MAKNPSESQSTYNVKSKKTNGARTFGLKIDSRPNEPETERNNRRTRAQRFDGCQIAGSQPDEQPISPRQKASIDYGFVVAKITWGYEPFYRHFRCIGSGGFK